MPNLRPSHQYIARMIRLESRAIAGINTARAEFRRAALDLLYSGDLTYAKARQITSLIDQLAARVRTLQSGLLQPMDELVLWYMNQQLGLLRAVGQKRLPNIQQLNLGTYSKRAEMYELLQTTPAWIVSMKKNMELNLTKSIVSKTDTSRIIDRLFSINIEDGRASVARLAGAAAETETKSTLWTSSILSMFTLYEETSQATGTVYMKQAIATIDDKTTDCCLQVHGQIQPLDKPFQLTGEPRYADEVDNPPFHWNCRTAEALYTEAMEDKGITSADMRDAASAERRARQETGKRVPIWPSHATSRRGG